MLFCLLLVAAFNGKGQNSSGLKVYYTHTSHYYPVARKQDTVKVIILTKGRKIDEGTYWPLIIEGWEVTKQVFIPLHWVDDALVEGHEETEHVKYLMKDKKTPVTDVIETYGSWLKYTPTWPKQ